MGQTLICGQAFEILSYEDQDVISKAKIDDLCGYRAFCWATELELQYEQL